MRTRQYTLSQIRAKYNNKKTASGNSLYDCYDTGAFYLLDKNSKITGNDFCRETICSFIHDYIKQGLLPTYIGICVNTTSTVRLENSKNLSAAGLERLIRRGEIKIPGKKKNEDKQIQKIFKMSKKITFLEKKFKFTPHTLKCFGIKDYKEITVNKIYTHNNCASYQIYIDATCLLALKVDKQWFSSPPVLSYFLLCMREYLSGYPSSSLKSGLMFELLRENKPKDLFGYSRKANWGVNKTEVFKISPYPLPSSFDETYGVDMFEEDYKKRASVILRDKFPNNRFFD